MEAVVYSEQTTCLKTEISSKLWSKILTSCLLALNTDSHLTELQNDGAWKLLENPEVVSPNR